MKNTKIKKILIPIDFSDASQVIISEAMTLARLLEASVTLMHVAEYTAYYLMADPQSPTIPPPFEDIEKDAKEKMEKISDEINKKYDIEPDIHIAAGDIHDEIVAYAEKNSIDLIAMGTHGASGYKELFIGSNAQRVVTLSDIPVLTILAEKKKPGFRNILVPIDDALQSRQKVNLAMLFAKMYKAKVHILGLPGTEDQTEINKFNIKLESVEHVAKELGLEFKTITEHGDNLAETAMEYASVNDCDLIVINTGHESKLTGMFLGAFAQQIVNHSKVPVLSYKHESGHYSIGTPGFGVG